MDAMKTHGAFSWSELMTSDAKAATEFYGGLFGWKFDVMDMGDGPYHVVKVGDTSIAGIMKTPADAGAMPPMWGVYVTVGDADAAVRKATGLGAKVLKAPSDIPGVGRWAVLQDPQGAVFNVISYVENPQ